MRMVMSCLIAAGWAGQLPAQDTTGAGQLPAQDTTGATSARGAPQEERLHKDPTRARLLGSVFPGAGQIYVGEYMRGARVYLTTVSAIGGGLMVYLLDDCLFSWASATRCDPGPQWPRQAVGIAMIGVGFGAWIWGARDAGRMAERANRNYGRTVKVSPLLQPSLSDGVGGRVGLALNW